MTAVVRQYPTRDRKQPRQWLAGDPIKRPPGDQKDLGHDLVRGGRIRPAPGVGVYPIGMIAVDPLEPLMIAL